MTFEEARTVFLKQREQGLDQLMLRPLILGPAGPDANDFVVVDRLPHFEEERKSGIRKQICSEGKVG